MRAFSMVSLVLALGLVVGCAQTGTGTKQTAGALGGAALGGLLGSQFGGGTGNLVATGLGVFAGALIGSEVGKSLDRADQNYARQAAHQSFQAPVGDTISWNNPGSGHGGTYTTVRDGYSRSGSYCREFRQTIVVDGRERQAFGVACEQPDGSWKIIE